MPAIGGSFGRGTSVLPASKDPGHSFSWASECLPGLLGNLTRPENQTPRP